MTAWREQREALGVTLSSVADEAGMTKSYLSMIENNKVLNPPSRGAIESLEKALGFADGELLRAAHSGSGRPNIRQQVEQLAKEARRGQDLAPWLKESTDKRKEGFKGLDKVYRSGGACPSASTPRWARPRARARPRGTRRWTTRCPCATACR